MHGDSDYCLEHCRHIGRCLEHIEELLAQDRWETYKTIAFGTLLQNVYMGIESILRYEIIQRGEKVGRGESWHQDLLRRAAEIEVITDDERGAFQELFLFRHRHTHGYGLLLDESKLRGIAEDTIKTCRQYVRRIEAEL